MLKIFFKNTSIPFDSQSQDAKPSEKKFYYELFFFSQKYPPAADS
jgi:hypothetical protein